MKTTYMYTIWNLMVAVLYGFSVVYCKRQKPRPDEIERVINDTHSKIWKCSTLECAFGQGSSVPCGTSIPFSVHIECVECVDGKNYSDSHGYSHCKRCRQCAEYEKSSGKCTKEEDTTKCLQTCYKGFYWDDLTDSCRPCSDCCKEAFQFQKHCKNSDGQCGNYTLKCEHPTTASQDKKQANQRGNSEKEGLSMLEIAAIVISTLLIIVVVVVVILLVMWKLYGWQEAKNTLRKWFCFCCCAANSNDENTSHFKINETFDDHGDFEPFTWTESEIHLEEAADKIGSLKPVIPVVKRPGFRRLLSVPDETSPVKKLGIPRSHSHPGCLKDLSQEPRENEPSGLKRYINDWRAKKLAKEGYMPVPADSDLPDSINERPACTEREEKPQKLNPPTLFPKDQSTSTTGLYRSPSINPLTSVPQDFQSFLLSRKMAKIPNKFYCKICNKLDILRQGFWNDYRIFGEAIGLDKDQVLWLGQTGTPTDKMIKEFDSQKNSSIAKFKEIMENMERYDVVSVIDEWIVHEWNVKCISSSATLV